MNLSKAITQTKNWGERAVDMVRKAAPASANLPDLIAATPFGQSTAGSTRAANQLGHYVGHQYTAVSAIAKRVAGQPINLYGSRTSPRGIKIVSSPSAGELVKLDNHPLLDLLNDPNDLLTRWHLVFSTVASLNITGKAFWWFTPSADGEIDVWPIPASWVDPADPMHTAWKIRPFGRAEPLTVDSAYVAYFSLPDPSNPLEAASPLQAQAAVVDTDEQLQLAQATGFRNMIRPPMVLRVGKNPSGDPTGGEGMRPVLTPEQRKQLIETVCNYHRGYSQGGPMILDGMIEEVFEYAAKSEMDFLKSGEQTRDRIFHAFGVNPLIVGEIQGANYAQANVAEGSFCDNVVNPTIMLLNQVLNGWVCPLFAGPDERLVLEIEPCRARDAEQEQKDWSIAATRGFVTPNEYRAERLGLPSIDGGDDLPAASGPAISPAAMQLAKTIDPYRLKRIA